MLPPKSYKDTLWHRDCKTGLILKPGHYSDLYRCIACRREWSQRVMENFTLEQLADRFYLEPPTPPTDEWILVEVVHGKKKHTELIQRLYEAHWVKLKLEDLTK